MPVVLAHKNEKAKKQAFGSFFFFNYVSKNNQLNYY